VSTLHQSCNISVIVVIDEDISTFLSGHPESEVIVHVKSHEMNLPPWIELSFPCELMDLSDSSICGSFVIARHCY